MRAIFAHNDWTQLEEGAVTKTTFFGVQKVWFVPGAGLVSLLLQSGGVYEHALEPDWEYSVIDDTDDIDYLAIDMAGEPKGHFVT